MGISQAKIELTISESQIEYKLLHATKQKKTSTQLVWGRGAIDFAIDACTSDYINQLIMNSIRDGLY